MKNTKSKFGILLVAVLCSFVSFNTAWAKSYEDKIKSKIDDVADSLKDEVDRLGEDLVAAQRYLDNYQWKGLIQDQASSKNVTLKHLQLNGHSKATVVRPGERVEGMVLCDLDREKCHSLSLYRVVVGIKGQGAQTTIGNELGVVAGESLEKFSLIAPSKPGIYQIRFRLVKSLLEDKALKAWIDDYGHEPDGTTTIGLLIVK